MMMQDGEHAGMSVLLRMKWSLVGFERNAGSRFSQHERTAKRPFTAIWTIGTATGFRPPGGPERALAS